MEERVDRWRPGQVVELIGELESASSGLFGRGSSSATARRSELESMLGAPPPPVPEGAGRRRAASRARIAPGRRSMAEGERQLARRSRLAAAEPTGDLLSALVTSGISPDRCERRC